ncbi:MAG: hypothetical protein LBL07_15380 [Tannerella sp.]|nr:hypothetical protein [Tannerella sp.]
MAGAFVSVNPGYVSGEGTRRRIMPSAGVCVRAYGGIQGQAACLAQTEKCRQATGTSRQTIGTSRHATEPFPALDRNFPERNRNFLLRNGNLPVAGKTCEMLLQDRAGLTCNTIICSLK